MEVNFHNDKTICVDNFNPLNRKGEPKTKITQEVEFKVKEIFNLHKFLNGIPYDNY